MKKSTRKITLDINNKLTAFFKENIKNQVFVNICNKYKVTLKINNVGMLVIKGDKDGSLQLQEAFTRLSELKRKISVEDCVLILTESPLLNMDEIKRDVWDEFAFRDKQGKFFTVKPKTPHQKELIEEIYTKQVIFAGGSAGTGKTFLSCAVALSFLEKKLIRKIIVTRPHVTSEEFGFLPGDIDSKMMPFLIPVFSIFEELIGREKRDEYIDKGWIEILPVAFSRGVTLGGRNGVITIIDESENLTMKQAYLMLTRLGGHVNSKIIFAGDELQTDLKRNGNTLSSLKKILKDSPYVGWIDFDSSDVVRSEVVKDILKRFEDYEIKKLKEEESESKSKNKNKPRGSHD